MASIEKRIGKNGDISYRALVRVKGFPTQCQTFLAKKKADEWAERTEISIKDGLHLAVVESRRRTLGEAIDRYIKDVLPTKHRVDKETIRQLAVWKELLGGYALIAVKPDIIKKAWADIAERETPKGRKKTPATLNRYMASLSVVFTYAYKGLEWIDANPIEKINKFQEPRGRVRYLDDAERERLLTACKESPNPLLYPAVVLAITTGARSSEILGLRWADIDLDAGRAILHETKNGERRTLAIVEPALSLLREMATVKGDAEFVFHSRRDTGEIHHANITRAWYVAM
ncbi:MAG: site-specific integrase, partial [Rickettsiales bacterium]|nr:site-specific integrase [Rickettsiales bacterium]